MILITESLHNERMLPCTAKPSEQSMFVGWCECVAVCVFVVSMVGVYVLALSVWLVCMWCGCVHVVCVWCGWCGRFCDVAGNAANKISTNSFEAALPSHMVPTLFFVDPAHMLVHKPGD